MSNGELIAFVLWGVVEFALALSAILVIVHRAVALPHGSRLPTHFLIGWAVTWGGAMVGLSLLGGALVFRRTAPWDVVLTWPWLVGGAVFVAYMLGLSGQMDQGSRLCGNQPGGCDLSWGFGGAIVGGAAAPVLGGTFAVGASLKRLLLRRGQHRPG
ncbi:MAG TPA: hypothetical protein VFA37_09785 [Gaiellaceae bacterium]|nr:hypothetical protein [Gaiellaceae bacterium]